jgi:hypothetical protein
VETGTRFPSEGKQKELVMFNRYPAYVGLVVVLFLSFGCATLPHEKNWGKSFEMTKDAQVLDPDASGNLAPVTGLDGQAAANAMNRYQKGSDGDKGSCGRGTQSLIGVLGGTATKP